MPASAAKSRFFVRIEFEAGKKGISKLSRIHFVERAASGKTLREGELTTQLREGPKYLVALLLQFASSGNGSLRDGKPSPAYSLYESIRKGPREWLEALFGRPANEVVRLFFLLSGGGTSDKCSVTLTPAWTRCEMELLYIHQHHSYKQGPELFSDAGRFLIESGDDPKWLITQSASAGSSARKATLDPALLQTCRQVMEAMERTWKRLPLSKKLQEPLPLRSIARRKTKAERLADQEFENGFDAILSAIWNHCGKPIIVEGVAGGGKTTALRWAAYCLAERAMKDPSALLPVYVDLGRTGQWSATDTLKGLLAKQLSRRIPIDYEPFISSERRKLILLDGLDLVSDQRVRRALLDDVWTDPNIPVLVSTRLDVRLASWLQDWPEVLWISLSALDRSAREQWLKDNTSDSAREHFRTIISQNPHLGTLLDVPLVFAMTASVCVDSLESVTFDVTRYSGRAGVFDGFVTFAIERAIEETRLPRDAKQEFNHFREDLELICALAVRAGFQDRIPDEFLARQLTGAQCNLDRKAAWRKALHILEEAGILARDEEEESYRFLHQQFAEYFAARAYAARWREAESINNFESSFLDLAKELRFDDITSQALAILYSDPSTKPLVKKAFDATAAADIAGACKMLAASGSQFAAQFLAPMIRGEGGLNPMARLDVISTAANIPSLEMLNALTEVVLKEGEQDVFQWAAIASIGRMELPESPVKLNQIARRERLPRNRRISALAQGASLDDPNELKDLIVSAINDPAERPPQKQDAIEAIVRSGHPDAPTLCSLWSETHPDALVRWFAASRMRGQNGESIAFTSSQGVSLPPVGQVPDVASIDPEKLTEETALDLLRTFETGEAQNPDFVSAVTELLQLCLHERAWQIIDDACVKLGVSLDQRGEFAKRAGRRIFDPEFEKKAYSGDSVPKA